MPQTNQSKVSTKLKPISQAINQLSSIMKFKDRVFDNIGKALTRINEAFDSIDDLDTFLENDLDSFAALLKLLEESIYNQIDYKYSDIPGVKKPSVEVNKNLVAQDTFDGWNNLLNNINLLAGEEYEPLKKTDTNENLKTQLGKALESLKEKLSQLESTPAKKPQSAKHKQSSDTSKSSVKMRVNGEESADPEQLRKIFEMLSKTFADLSLDGANVTVKSNSESSDQDKQDAVRDAKKVVQKAAAVMSGDESDDEEVEEDDEDEYTDESYDGESEYTEDDEDTDDESEDTNEEEDTDDEEDEVEEILSSRARLQNNLRTLFEFLEATEKGSSDYYAFVMDVLKAALAVKNDKYNLFLGDSTFAKELSFYEFLQKLFVPSIESYSDTPEIFGDEAKAKTREYLREKLGDNEDGNILFPFAYTLDELGFPALLDNIVDDDKQLTNANLQDALKTALDKKIESMKLLQELSAAVAEIAGPVRDLLAHPLSMDKRANCCAAVQEVFKIVASLDPKKFTPRCENAENIRTLVNILQNSFLENALGLEGFIVLGLQHNLEVTLREQKQLKGFSLLENADGGIERKLWDDFIKMISFITHEQVADKYDPENLIPQIEVLVKSMQNVLRKIDYREEIPALPESANVAAMAAYGSEGSGVFQGFLVQGESDYIQTGCIVNLPNTSQEAIKQNFYNSLEALLREAFANKLIWQSQEPPAESEIKSLLKSIIKVTEDPANSSHIIVEADFSNAISDQHFAKFKTGLKRIDSNFRNNELAGSGAKQDLLNEFYGKINRGQPKGSPELKFHDTLAFKNSEKRSVLTKLREKSQRNWPVSELALRRIAERLAEEFESFGAPVRLLGTVPKWAAQFEDQAIDKSGDHRFPKNMSLACLRLFLDEQDKQKLDALLKGVAKAGFESPAKEKECIEQRISSMLKGDKGIIDVINKGFAESDGQKKQGGYDKEIKEAVAAATNDGEPIHDYLLKLAGKIVDDVHESCCLHDFLRGDQCLLDSTAKNKFSKEVCAALEHRRAIICDKNPAAKNSKMFASPSHPHVTQTTTQKPSGFSPKP